MTLEELERALSDATASLDRIYGHLAITQQRERELRGEGYKDGYAAGFKAGKAFGFAEGYKEGKVFPEAA